MVLDMYDDRGAFLLENFPRRGDLPDWVLNGLQGADFSDSQKLAADDFALQLPLKGGMRSAFPIYNDAVTAISCLYFDEYHENLPPAYQKQAAAALMGACDRFDVEAPEKVAELSKEYQVAEKSASQPKNASVSGKNGNSKTASMGSLLEAMDNPAFLKKASDNYGMVMRKFAPDARREFSQQFIVKCAEHKVAVPQEAYLWGGENLSRAGIMLALEKRAAFLDEGQLSLLRSAADKIYEMHPDKVAELLTTMDTELGLDALWDTKIPDPMSIFERSKVAEVMVKVAGLELPQGVWDSAVEAGVLDAFDPRLKAQLSRNPELLNSSPALEDHVRSGLESLGLA